MVSVVGGCFGFCYLWNKFKYRVAEGRFGFFFGVLDGEVIYFCGLLIVLFFFLGWI